MGSGLAGTAVKIIRRLSESAYQAIGAIGDILSDKLKEERRVQRLDIQKDRYLSGEVIWLEGSLYPSCLNNRAKDC